MKVLKKIFNFYKDGFSNLTIGKSLWKIILIKLFIILIFFNFFIYDKSLKTEYKTDDEKIEYVLNNFMKGK